MNPKFSLRVASLLFLGALATWGASGCATLPEPKLHKYTFPKEAYLHEPTRSYTKLGLVRTRVDYPAFTADHEDTTVCENYFNKAAIDLLKRSKDQGGDAVMQVQSVVFLIDGRQETFAHAECADDGEGGQVLAQGIAIKWKTKDLQTVAIPLERDTNQKAQKKEPPNSSTSFAPSSSRKERKKLSGQVPRPGEPAAGWW